MYDDHKSTGGLGSFPQAMQQGYIKCLKIEVLLMYQLYLLL